MHQASAHAPTKKFLLKPILCAVAALLALTLLPNGADAAAPRLEGFPSYHPQTKCSPKAKPGTVMLANHLMRRYRGSGSLGISRSCRDGGVSEHKEGRAFDWALSAASRRDRHYAADFLNRVRKTDRFGRRGALGRRMGIMYLIWNDRIYSASRHYKGRRYLNAGCRSIKRCSVSLRHRNHMHISLTRAAARKDTSWYRQGSGKTVHKVKHKAKAKAGAKRHHSRARQRAHLAHHRTHDRAHNRQHRASSRTHRVYHRRHKAASHRADRAYHRRHQAARRHAHRVYHQRHKHVSRKAHRKYHRRHDAARHRAHRVYHHRHSVARRHAHGAYHRALHRTHVRQHRAHRHAHRVYHRRHKARPQRRARMTSQLVAPAATVQSSTRSSDIQVAAESWRNVTDWSEDAIGSDENP